MTGPTPAQAPRWTRTTRSLACTGIVKQLPRGACTQGVDFEVRRGEDPRARRGERRWKIHARQDPDRGLPSDAGQIVLDGVGQCDITRPQAAADHGIAIVHQDSRRSFRSSTRRGTCSSAARTDGTGALLDFPRDARRDGRGPRARRRAVRPGYARPRPHRGPAGARRHRVCAGAAARRSSSSTSPPPRSSADEVQRLVRHHPVAQGPWRDHHLHLAPPRRGVAAGGPHHGPARRHAGGNAGHRRDRPRRDHPDDDRPRPDATLSQGRRAHRRADPRGQGLAGGDRGPGRRHSRSVAARSTASPGS